MQDQLHSIRELVKRDGTWIMNQRFRPNGQLLAQETGGALPALRYGWTGREYDAETGLYFHRARYYEPGQRRWTQEDPIGYDGGANLYAYVGGHVLAGRDPYGLDTWYECTNVYEWHTRGANTGQGGGIIQVYEWDHMDCVLHHTGGGGGGGGESGGGGGGEPGNGGKSGPGSGPGSGPRNPTGPNGPPSTPPIGPKQGCTILGNPNCVGKSPMRKARENSQCFDTIGPAILATTIDVTLVLSGVYEVELGAVGATEAVAVWRRFKVAGGAFAYGTTAMAAGDQFIGEYYSGQTSGWTVSKVLLAAVNHKPGVSTAMALGDLGQACGQVAFGH